MYKKVLVPFRYLCRLTFSVNVSNCIDYIEHVQINCIALTPKTLRLYGIYKYASVVLGWS